MSDSEPRPFIPQPSRTAVMVMAILILVPCGVAFIFKFYELIIMVTGDVETAHAGAFAITPVINYLLASLGFICLFSWAALGGMFRNVEEPKMKMLELDAQIEQRSRG